MEKTDLIRVSLIDGPADGKTILTPTSNTRIRYALRVAGVYEIHEYVRDEDENTDRFYWEPTERENR